VQLAQRRQEFGRPTYTAYVDLSAAFDSQSSSSVAFAGYMWHSAEVNLAHPGSLWWFYQLCACWLQKSLGFVIASGLHESCVIAPDSFATSMDWLLERLVSVHSSGLCRWYIPSGWAAGVPRSCSREIPGGSCTTWSRSELAKNNGSSTGLCQGRAFKSLHLWAQCPTCGIIWLPRSRDSLVL